VGTTQPLVWVKVADAAGVLPPLVVKRRAVKDRILWWPPSPAVGGE